MQSCAVINNAQTLPTSTPKASPWKVGTPAPSVTPKSGSTSSTPTSAGVKAPQSPVTTPKLTNQQIKDAKAWYAQQSHQYTPEVIKQIQQKMGVKQTGTVDTQTLQAIAKWEANNKPLPMDGKQGKFAVDGKADVTLLEHLFPSKYISPEAVAAYNRDFKALEGKWASLSPDQREEALERIINRQLKRVGVPEVQVVSNANIGGSSGKFTQKDWQISLRPSVINQDELYDPAELASTLFHEGEHTRQAFEIARLSSQILSDPVATFKKFMPENYLRDAMKKEIKYGSIDGIKALAYWYDTFDKKRGGDNDALNDAQARRDDIIAKYNKVELTVTPDMDKYFKAANNANSDAEKKKYEALFDKAAQPIRLEARRLEGLLRKAQADVDAAWLKYASHPLEANAWRADGIIERDYPK